MSTDSGNDTKALRATSKQNKVLMKSSSGNKITSWQDYQDAKQHLAELRTDDENFAWSTGKAVLGCSTVASGIALAIADGNILPFVFLTFIAFCLIVEGISVSDVFHYQNYTICDEIRSKKNEQYSTDTVHSLAFSYGLPESTIVHILHRDYTKEQESRISRNMLSPEAADRNLKRIAVLKVRGKNGMLDSYPCRLCLSHDKNIPSLVKIPDIPFLGYSFTAELAIGSFMREDREATSSLITDDEGTATFMHVDDGDYIVSVFHGTITTVSLEDGKQSELTIPDSRIGISAIDTQQIVSHWGTTHGNNSLKVILADAEGDALKNHQIDLLENSLFSQTASERIVVESNNHVIYDGPINTRIILNPVRLAAACNDNQKANGEPLKDISDEMNRWIASYKAYASYGDKLTHYPSLNELREQAAEQSNGNTAITENATDTAISPAETNAIMDNLGVSNTITIKKTNSSDSVKSASKDIPAKQDIEPDDATPESEPYGDSADGSTQSAVSQNNQDEQQSPEDTISDMSYNDIIEKLKGKMQAQNDKNQQ